MRTSALEPEFFSAGWCGYSWTAWMPLHGQAADFSLLPKSPGVYRVRPVGQRSLVYIGETGRSLRHRLRTLSQHTYAEQMPFNDPHTAAPCLWAWRIETGMSFEVSAASLYVPKQELRATEDMLLWRYRLENGGSTLCNHGRFHPCYSRSTSRERGRRGGKLPPGEENSGGGPSAAPLAAHGDPQDDDWMGLSWSALKSLTLESTRLLPGQAALYKILDLATPTLLYLGETTRLRARMRQHARSPWGQFAPVFSFSLLPQDTKRHQRLELETDLLGCHYAAHGCPPIFQYGTRLQPDAPAA